MSLVLLHTMVVAITSAESPMGVFTSTYSEDCHFAVPARHRILWRLCPVPASRFFDVSAFLKNQQSFASFIHFYILLINLPHSQ